MNRRESLQSFAALTVGAVSTGAAHAQERKHGGHDYAGGSKFQRLTEYAGDCVGKGDACLAHCLVVLGEGDKSLAECARAVNQMLSACGALQSLSAQRSRLTAAMAKVALDACNECEQACKPHAQKHADCKACMEACAECAKECRSFSA